MDTRDKMEFSKQNSKKKRLRDFRKSLITTNEVVGMSASYHIHAKAYTSSSDTSRLLQLSASSSSSSNTMKINKQRKD